MGHSAFDWLNFAAASIAALGTVGGFGWAIYLYRGELKRRQEDQADAHMAQARLVTGWLTSSQATYDKINRDGIFIRNGSEQPVYTAKVCTRDETGRVGMWGVGVVPPNTTVERLRLTDGQKPIPGTSVPIAFWFKDAASQHWFRDWDGELRAWPTEGEPEWWPRVIAKQRIHEGELLEFSTAPTSQVGQDEAAVP